MSADAAPVASKRLGRAAVITLDRGRALNALDRTMIDAMRVALDTAERDDGVECIVVRSADSRAFCAGGDIRAIRDHALRGEAGAVRSYFEAEYALNARIARCPKPYVALIDGICMGGGLGISMHGAARVVTSAARLAMPETIIGFVPDVGASYVLPRLSLDGWERGAFGRYLALAGVTVDAAEALRCGLATHYAGRDELAALPERIGADGLAALPARPAPGPGPAEDERARIAPCFAHERPEAVLAALDATGGALARDTAAAIRARSPTALALTALLLRRGAELDLEECLGLELELACLQAAAPDFAEGVRAALVDKDRSPRWQPPALDPAERDALDATFAAAAARARRITPGETQCG